MKKTLAALALAASLGACATAKPIALTTPYDRSDFAWAEARGTNSIRGSAVLRTVGGEVRSCGGYEANLIPDTPYSRERMSHLYGSTERGFQQVPNILTPQITFEQDPADYQSVGRTSACDAQGEFEFNDLPDGPYFVVVPIIWSVPTGYVTEMQGGRLMKRIELSGGERERVVLTQ